MVWLRSNLLLLKAGINEAVPDIERVKDNGIYEKQARTYSCTSDTSEGRLMMPVIIYKATTCLSAFSLVARAERSMS